MAFFLKNKIFSKYFLIIFGYLFILNISIAEEINFDDSIIDLILESSLQKPANQATTLERESAIQELTNIYLISNLPRTIEISKDPLIKAQLELQQKVILFNAFANDFYAKNQPTDLEIQSFYEDQIGGKTIQEFKARHILVETEEKANLLISSLKDGANFIELAETNSIGPSAETGGDLGWFNTQSMVKPFSDAVLAMKNGEFSDYPVMTQFGWHVILREDSRNASPPPLGAVRESIIQQLIQQKFLIFIEDLNS